MNCDLCDAYELFYRLEKIISLLIWKVTNALSIELIPSSKFFPYFKRVIHFIHLDPISILSKIALNVYSNVV